MTRHDPDRATRILDVIELFTSIYGHPPSVRDIAQRVGLASTASVHWHLVVRCRCGCGRVRVAP